MINVHMLPILNDNYSFVLINGGKECIIIDPGAADPLIEYIEKNKLNLTFILNTHHHWDHTDGNAALIEKYDAKLVGPKAEQAKIKGLDISLSENDTFEALGEIVETIETPGHTAGHICFYFTQSGILFAGDTLFSMGCGRLFEGTAEQMHGSLEKLKSLPDETVIYCGHEYTKANAKFCLSIEPENKALQQRAKDVAALRAEKKPTLPVTLQLEKETNVFLRAKNADEFAHRRHLKDNF